MSRSSYDVFDILALSAEQEDDFKSMFSDFTPDAIIIFISNGHPNLVSIIEILPTNFVPCFVLSHNENRLDWANRKYDAHFANATFHLVPYSMRLQNFVIFLIDLLSEVRDTIGL
ncbi:MAG: hypothetical protein AAFV93_00350 [Chloroflexota bacterium]